MQLGSWQSSKGLPCEDVDEFVNQPTQKAVQHGADQ